jgi:hypothetical protein
MLLLLQHFRHLFWVRKELVIESKVGKVKLGIAGTLTPLPLPAPLPPTPPL